MPVLDLEFWIGAVEVEGSMKQQILFSHYMKPMANKYLINNRSALSATMKTNLLVADLVRSMKNVYILCPEIEKQRNISSISSKECSSHAITDKSVLKSITKQKGSLNR